MAIPMVTPSHSLSGEELEVDEQLAEMLEPWNLNPDDFKGREFETREEVQSVKRKLGAKHGYQFEELFGRRRSLEYSIPTSRILSVLDFLSVIGA